MFRRVIYFQHITFGNRENSIHGGFTNAELTGGRIPAA
jgi:hypothetical protein